MVECLCYSPTLLHGRLKAHLRFIVEHASKHTGARPLSPRMCLCFVFRVWRPAVKHACFVFRVWRGRETRVFRVSPMGPASIEQVCAAPGRLGRRRSRTGRKVLRGCARVGVGGRGLYGLRAHKGAHAPAGCSCQGGGGARSFRMRRRGCARSGGRSGGREGGRALGGGAVVGKRS